VRPPASSSLYVHVDPDRVPPALPDRVPPALPGRWQAAGLDVELAGPGRPVRWGLRLMASRHTGRWSRGRHDGACTLDLVPAGAGRTLLVLTMDQPRGWLAAPVETEHARSLLVRLRAEVEAAGVRRPSPVATPDPVAPVPAAVGGPLAPPTQVASGILPA